MSFTSRTRLRGGLALSSILFGAACVDRVSAPVSTTPAGISASVAAAAAPARIPNSVRYRDQGAKPTTGRAGAAALSSFALIGRDGITRLEVHSAHADAPAVPAGTLAKVQVKRFGSDALLATSNHRIGQSSAVFALPGLTRGSRVQVQANIRDIDRARTGVVTVIDTVRRRPDLSVSQLTLPGEIVAGTPTIVSAVVRELHGDLGVTTDCVLLVDGSEVDRAERIWVDAGDAVTCAFTHDFASGGNHAVLVRVEGSIPGDDDAANDAASGTTHVTVEVNDAFTYQANVDDYASTRDWLNRELSRNVVTGESSDWTMSSHDSVRIHGAIFSGTLPVALAFPLERIELSQRSGGALVHAATIAGRGYDVETGAGVRCANEAFGAGFSAVICAGAATTSVVYRRDGTAATYQGGYFAEVWYQSTGGLDSYVVNVPIVGGRETGAAGGDLITDYAFGVRLTQGDWRYIHDAPVAMTTLEPLVLDTPYACQPDVVSGDVVRRSCASSYSVSRSTTGFSTGSSALP